MTRTDRIVDLDRSAEGEVSLLTASFCRVQRFEAPLESFILFLVPLWTAACPLGQWFRRAVFERSSLHEALLKPGSFRVPESFSGVIKRLHKARAGRRRLAWHVRNVSGSRLFPIRGLHAVRTQAALYGRSGNARIVAQ